MSFLNTLLKDTQNKRNEESSIERGLLMYNSVNDVIQAETVLKKSDFQDIRVVAPPPHHRTGCDLSIEFPIIEQIGILRVLEQNNIPPEQIMQVDEELMKPTEICSIKDFGKYLMVRSANMKITVDKESGIIVNISGGGCSDVPYLAREMIGKTLDTAPSPRTAGYTLCAYTLAIAFEELRKHFV